MHSEAWSRHMLMHAHGLISMCRHVRAGQPAHCEARWRQRRVAGAPLTQRSRPWLSMAASRMPMRWKLQQQLPRAPGGSYWRRTSPLPEARSPAGGLPRLLKPGWIGFCVRGLALAACPASFRHVPVLPVPVAHAGEPILAVCSQELVCLSVAACTWLLSHGQEYKDRRLEHKALFL